jgi:hypothetical protein
MGKPNQIAFCMTRIVETMIVTKLQSPWSAYQTIFNLCTKIQAWFKKDFVEGEIAPSRFIEKLVVLKYDCFLCDIFRNHCFLRCNEHTKSKQKNDYLFDRNDQNDHKIGLLEMGITGTAQHTKNLGNNPQFISKFACFDIVELENTHSNASSETGSG